MELLKLKRRLRMARRGHKLMKDKFEELLKEFTQLVQEAYRARTAFEKILDSGYDEFAALLAEHSPGSVETTLLNSPVIARVSARERRRAGVPLVTASLEVEGDVAEASVIHFGPRLREVGEKAREALEAAVRLAETEHNVLLLAAEMERTRRRVNALEQVLIPQLEGQIKAVTAKLEEMDRESRTRVMKVKEMLEAARLESAQK
jgi:V/A-type H+-transporting ATPase subunit D